MFTAARSIPALIRSYSLCRDLVITETPARVGGMCGERVFRVQDGDDRERQAEGFVDQAEGGLSLISAAYLLMVFEGGRCDQEGIGRGSTSGSASFL